MSESKGLVKKRKLENKFKDRDKEKVLNCMKRAPEKKGQQAEWWVLVLMLIFLATGVGAQAHLV